MRPIRVAILFIISAIILGALGAHVLKGVLNPSRLNGFKTGVSYLMYSGLGLLAIEALSSKFTAKSYRLGTKILIIGTLIFSGSIFLLSGLNHFKIEALNPIIGPSTPIGGFMMILAWIIIFVNTNTQSCTKDT